MKTLIKLTVVLVFLFSTTAQAALLTLSPSSPVVGLGDQVAIEINVSGLGEMTAPSLSTYDLNMVFDNTVFSPNSIVFGNSLDLMGIGGIQFVSLIALDTINIFELSFDSTTILNSMQSGSFTLATVFFDAVSHGVGQFDIGVNAFGDARGDSLPVDVSNTAVQVGPIDVPEPSTLWLAMIPALAAWVISKVNRK